MNLLYISMKIFLTPLSFDATDIVKCKGQWPDQFACGLIMCLPFFPLQPGG